MPELCELLVDRGATAIAGAIRRLAASDPNKYTLTVAPSVDLDAALLQLRGHLSTSRGVVRRPGQQAGGAYR